MVNFQKKQQKNKKSRPQLVVFLVASCTAVALFIHFLVLPTFASFIHTQEIAIDSDPTTKNQVVTTSKYGIKSVIEIPKTTNQAINQQLESMLQTQQQAFFDVSLKLSNRLKTKGEASHKIAFDWYVVDQDVYSVIFYDYWNIDHVAHRYNVSTYLIDANTNQVIPTSNLIDFSAMNQEKLINKIMLKLKADNLILHSTESLEKSIENFMDQPTILVESNRLKFYFQSAQLKTNQGTFTSISLPLISFKKAISPVLLDILPLSDESIKRVAFTFDDGPNTNTRLVLDVLKKYDAKATFFVLGQQVAQFPTISQEIIAAGHEIGNHSYSHKDLVAISPSAAQAEIEKTNAIVLETTGSTISLFRPPYGRYNKQVKGLSDLRITLWNVDPLDWKVRVPSSIVKNIMDHVENNSVILMHDIYTTSAQALDVVLEKLTTQDYEFVTLSELLEFNE